MGTALPESTIPIIAVLAGAEGEDVAIGAIVGAPFMLATVAMVLVATSALMFRERREQGREIDRYPTAAGLLGLAGGALAFWRLERGRMGGPAALAWASMFLALVVFVAVG